MPSLVAEATFMLALVSGVTLPAYPAFDLSLLRLLWLLSDLVDPSSLLESTFLRDIVGFLAQDERGYGV